MVIVVVLISLVLLGVLLAFPLAGLVLYGRSKAKREAKQMLASGEISDTRKAKRVMDILAKTPNDLEAADLWRELKKLETPIH